MDFPPSFLEPRLAAARASVTLRAPARLHLGFFDPGASLGRRFGSLGLMVNGFETEIELGASPSDRVCAADATGQAEIERAAAYLHLLQRHSGRPDPLQLRLVRVLPAHAGLGSGTQLALAVGRAFAQWHGLDLGTPALAQWLGRGARSGVGIAGFDRGGLLVDGGPSADGTAAPLLSRVAVPAAWRVLVVQDSAYQGLSGADERRAIATLPPLPQALAADICHQVLMRVLPGAASAEFAPFAAGITRIQQVLGEYFAPAQGGQAYTSAAVGRLLEWIGGAMPGPGQAAGPHCAIGQSSWGPTGFALLPSQTRAEAVVDAVRAANVVGASLTLRIVSARNAGASIVDSRAPAHAR